MSKTSRYFRELADYNKPGPLASSYTAASKSTCCPQMHRLTLTVAAEGLRCDLCRRGIKSGEAIYSCEPCDFDTCDACGSNSDGSTNYSTRGAVAPPVNLLPTDLSTELPEGNQALGRRLSVLWLEERPPTRFSGVIKQYDPANNEHLIVYDDGDQRWHSLETEVRLGNVKWLDRPDVSPPADAPPPAKRARSAKPAPAPAPERKQRRAEASAPAPKAAPKAAEKAPVERSWEETCPEFGDGWTRRSRQRAGASGVDHTYVSPAGKSFPSRVKVVQHLGLASDPGSQGGRRLTEEEREARLGAKLQKEKERVSQKQLLKEEAQRQKAQDKEKEKARKQQVPRYRGGAPWGGAA